MFARKDRDPPVLLKQKGNLLERQTLEQEGHLGLCPPPKKSGSLLCRVSLCFPLVSVAFLKAPEVSQDRFEAETEIASFQNSPVSISPLRTLNLALTNQGISQDRLMCVWAETKDFLGPCP